MDFLKSLLNSTPPCEYGLFKCKHFDSCNYLELACEDFNYFVQYDRVQHTERKPTKEMYEYIFEGNDHNDYWD